MERKSVLTAAICGRADDDQRDTDSGGRKALVQGSVLGSLDHVLVRADVDLDATVLRAAFSGGVVRDRVGVGKAL